MNTDAQPIFILDGVYGFADFKAPLPQKNRRSLRLIVDRQQHHRQHHTLGGGAQLLCCMECIVKHGGICNIYHLTSSA